MPGAERPPAAGPGLTPGGREGEDPPDTFALMVDGDLDVLGLMPRASNYTFLAEASIGKGTALVIYKPRAGEAPLWDFEAGTLCAREVAAYRLAKALGWPSVPPTVLRNGPHGPGSVQLFIDFEPSHHFFTLRDGRANDFRRIAAFDVVANNADRKSGHCLLGRDGRIWAIDHGVCFSAVQKLRTVIWDFADEPLDSTVREDVRRVAAELRGGPLRASMLEILRREEVDATAERAETLARAGRYPVPGSERHFPWPPV